MIRFAPMRYRSVIVKAIYAEAATAEAPPITPPPAAPPQAGGERLFTQAEVNNINAQDRKAMKKQLEITVTNLTEAQKNINLTKEEKELLQVQIEQLQGQYQTQEEQSRIASKKLQDKYDADTKQLSTDRDTWKQRFDSSLVEREITSASVTYKAFSPEQITALLAPNTKVVEALDSNGKPSGKWVAQVDFTGVDADGKPVKLNLSVPEAVKMMTEMPKKYGNLFQVEGSSGLGLMGSGGTTTGNMPDINKMSPQQYKQYRQQIRQQQSAERSQ